MEPDPERERDNPSQRDVERAWSPYEELAAREEAEWRRGRRRRLVFTGGIFLLVLCVAASVFGYFWFSRATKIDRNTPTVVVLQYVDTIFADRDVARAELFECDGTDPKGPLLDELRQVEERERQFNIVFIVDVTNYVVEEVGTTAKVRADIEFVAPVENGRLSKISQPWLFELRDEDGWRICRTVKQEP